MKWPLPEGWNDERIEAVLLVGGRPERPARRPLPDFKNIREQLQQHPHLTLQLIWNEYREQDAGGYGYSQFCELYRRWRATQDVVPRQDHKAGEKAFVDWAGATIPLHSAEAGDVRQAPLFVAVLGASSYTYAEATRNQQLDAWIETQIHALEYFRGVPRLIGSRASLFEALDRPALRPLPASRFDLGQWSKARVNIDYHIAFDTNFYSVPYQLVHEVVETRSAATTVEIFHKGRRVASHLRGRGHEKSITQEEHRPKSHQAHLEWTPSRMVSWAAAIGPNTAQLFERILADKPHPEMGYRSCLGIIRLASRYSAARMESAARLAIHTGACR